jgi:hypothetical protein
MLFLPGLILWFRKKREDVLALLVPLILYWAFCSLSYYWGGYSPPGRTLLPVLWIFGVFMGAATIFSGRKKPFVIIHILTGFTILNATLLARNTRHLFHENLSFPWAEPGKVSNILNSLSNAFIDFTRIVPSLSSQEGITWLPLIGWLLVFLLIACAFLRRKRVPEEGISRIGISAPLGLVFVVSILVVGCSFFGIRLEGEKSYPIGGGRVYFQDENTFGPELDGFWTKGGRSAEIILKSPKKAASIDVNLVQPEAGMTVVRAGNEIRLVARKNRKGADIQLVFPEPVGFVWKGDHFYSIKIKERGGFVPSKWDDQSSDRRYLGAFVKVRVRVN